MDGSRSEGVEVGSKRKPLVIPASPEFFEWANRAASAMRLSRAVAFEHGIIMLAQHSGFEDPPPKR
jgi:hypothetical protein